MRCSWLACAPVTQLKGDELQFTLLIDYMRMLEREENCLGGMARVNTLTLY